MSHRTAPRLWCARTLETEVKMIVAIEVAIAIFTARSDDTPRWPMMIVMKGTISMPPPMPRSPARKPVPRPSAASSRIRRGSRNSVTLRVFGQSNGPEQCVLGAVPDRKRCLQVGAEPAS
jgi:hypothetical protein